MKIAKEVEEEYSNKLIKDILIVIAYITTTIFILKYLLSFITLTGYKTHNYRKHKVKKTFLSESFSSFLSHFKTKTYLQKTDLWSKNRKKYVKWEFYVTEIDTDILGVLTVTGNLNKEISKTPDITVQFYDEEKNKLLKYNIGDLITCEGYLDSFGSIANENLIQVANGIVIENE